MSTGYSPSNSRRHTSRHRLAQVARRSASFGRRHGGQPVPNATISRRDISPQCRERCRHSRGAFALSLWPRQRGSTVRPPWPIPASFVDDAVHLVRATFLIWQPSSYGNQPPNIAGITRMACQHSARSRSRRPGQPTSSAGHSMILRRTRSRCPRI